MLPASVAQHEAHTIVVGEVIGSNLSLTPRYNKRHYKWFLLLLCQECDINSYIRVGRMPWPNTDTTHYHAQFKRVGCLMGVT